MNRLTAFFIVALLSVALASTAGTQVTDNPKSIRIIYTNDTVGYLEPWSCGGSYQGGLARRATVIARLVKENPNVLLVDSGNLTDKVSKLPLMTRLMADMHYDAVGIGEVDSGFADDYIKTACASGLKVLETTHAISSSATPYLIKKIGGVKVGVVSFGAIGNEVASIKPERRESFYAAYQKARKGSDVLIILDQGGIATKEWLEGEAVQLGAPDVVVGGVLNSVMSRERIVGRTHVVPTSVQGKLIGVLDVSLARGQLSNYTVQMVPVDKSSLEDEAVKRQIEDFIFRPKTLGTLSQSNLNMGSIKKGGSKEEYVTLTPKVAQPFTISKAYSSGSKVSAPEWKPASDGSYRIKIVADVGNVTGRFLETVSIELDLPDHPTLSLLVFGNIVDE
ncbi:MAG: hypothetical protein NT018_10480 [Armatimonadetes bacterium]|nr:hypothetical protein [Armatimonadota bacterium]